MEYIVIKAGPSQGLKFRGLVVLGGDNVSPLVEIGLGDQPNIGGAKAPPPPTLRRPCKTISGHSKIINKIRHHTTSILLIPYSC